MYDKRNRPVQAALCPRMRTCNEIEFYLQDSNGSVSYANCGIQLFVRPHNVNAHSQYLDFVYNQM